MGHGYLRAADGTITKYDVPGAGAGSGQGTGAGCINPAGTIVGNYVDANNVFHGYVRFPDGTITTFDVSGAGTGSLQGTYAFCNNPRDAITGYYIDANNVNHGFLRLPCRGASMAMRTARVMKAQMKVTQYSPLNPHQPWHQSTQRLEVAFHARPPRLPTRTALCDSC